MNKNIMWYIFYYASLLTMLKMDSSYLSLTQIAICKKFGIPQVLEHIFIPKLFDHVQ